MCKIIFFSCFVVISNVFTRFINDSVSLRIEPLTVRNCLPWIYHLSTWILKRLRNVLGHLLFSVCRIAFVGVYSRFLEGLDGGGGVGGGGYKCQLSFRLF